MWRDSRDKRLTPDDALKIYALKTAPAFEAALYCGLRLAGPADQYAEPVAQLAQHLGIAFQILNDLQDWQGDDFNKLTLGGDVLGGRPTVLWALALEGLRRRRSPRARTTRRRRRSDARRVRANSPSVPTGRCVRESAPAGRRASREAERVADELSPEALRRLAHHLIETVLEQPRRDREPAPARRPLAVPAR